MLSRLLDILHIQFLKGNRMHTIWQLLVNGLLHAKLRLLKLLKGIHRPIVHYYAVCWNEERMLPFVFDYYKGVADKFFIYDNHSSDSSLKIIANQPNAIAIGFGDENGFNDEENRRVKNHCWKHSRGRADLVIVSDMDEFLYHPDLRGTLEKMCKQHVSCPCFEGYEMYSERFPEHEEGKLLTDVITTGIRSTWLDKRLLFDPHRIVEMNYTEGAHQSRPVGVVTTDPSFSFKVLHYKHLGIDYLLSRYHALGERLSAYNREHDLGTHYLADDEKLRKDMEQGLSSMKDVI